MSKKILIVGPAWVGDMVMAQCLFKLLKARQPQAIIDVLAPAWSLPLLERMPEVSQGFVMSLGHGVLNLAERYRIGKRLLGNRYDQAIVLPNSFKSALIPFFAKIPQRTGWRGEMRYGLLNDVRILNKKRYPLMIERFMALGLERNESLPLEKYLPQMISTAETQNAILKKYQLTRSSKPVLAISPGAEFGPAKRWPENYYADVANSKLHEGWEVWLLGSPKDAVVTEQIMQLTQHKCVNLAGKTNLVDTVDLLALSSAVVCNDSGLMHIAAAVGKPLLAVYGPTSPGFTPPLNKNSKVLQLQLSCQPCFKRECPLQHHRCMRELLPEQVLHEMSEIM